MVKIYDERNIKNVPVKVSVLIQRGLFEEASEAAKIVGRGSIENLIIFLLENFVEEVKAAGYELKPFWELAREVRK